MVSATSKLSSVNGTKYGIQEQLRKPDERKIELIAPDFLFGFNIT